MPEKAVKITQGTLIPLALVITIVVGAWELATDRTKLFAADADQEKRLTAVEQDIKAMREDVRIIRESQQRMEIKIGTTPEKK